MRAAILILLFSSVAGANQTAIPPTPAGTTMARFLHDLDGGLLVDEPTWGHWYALYGPLRFQFVATSEPYDLRVWTKSDVTHTWVSVRVMLNSEPPHQLQDIRIGTGLRPLHVLPEPPLKFDEALGAIDRYFRELAASDTFSGAVLIARDGKVAWEKAFGLASKRYDVPNSVDTKFNVGSLTKLITAVGIAQLADAGKLAFTDSIRKFLPRYPSRATIHQLLTHTSGLGESRFSSDAFTDRFDRTVGDEIPMTIAKPAFAPGTGIRYSNEAYLLLGAIIEKASGEDYYDYVQRHIYAPAGMAASGAFEGDREVPNLATGYTFWRWKGGDDLLFERGERRNTEYMSALRGNPAGGTYSTVGDLNRLLQAIEDCKIVSCAMRDTMFRTQVARPTLPWAGQEEGYGYGVETKNIGGHDFIGKSGDLIGASAQLEFDRTGGTTVIVLSNYDSIAQPAADWIVETLLRVPKE